MAVTPGQEETLAPKPATVSSTSSLDTSGSLQNDYVNTHQSTSFGGNEASAGQSDAYPMQSAAYPATTVPSATNGIGQLPSSISLVPRGGSRLHISPSTGVVVPSSVPSTNTVPEFLYQLTKMLTDHNRDVIEWSNGKIEVHNPYKLQTHVLNRYFRHSKFASFQRQLNYFGFRKLAGKGKMAPCSYVNDATTHELGSLLLIKRKTGNEPKSKDGKKRERDNAAASQGAGKSGAQETAVNPVLAGILYRSTGDSSSQVQGGTVPTPATTAGQPLQSRQALAKVAVGKGIRHSFSYPKSAASNPPKVAATPNPLLTETPVQDSLSQLQSNFRNSLQDFATQDQSAQPPAAAAASSSSTNQYVPGSMRRDDSLVDLAMIPLIEGSTPGGTNASSGLTFVDFPWQDPNSPAV